MKHILVTGATGFIGRHLVKQLLMDGYQVSAIVRDIDKLAAQNPDCQPLPNGIALSKVEPVDGVINLSGESLFSHYWTYNRKQIIRSSRVAFTIELISKLRSSGHTPSVFLSGSAVGYYGESIKQRFTEKHAAGKDFGALLCDDWEQAAIKTLPAATRCVLLRTGIVLHPSGGALGQMLPPYNMGFGGRLANGQQGMSWIGMHDYLRAIKFCLLCPEISGPVNCVSPNPTTNQEFTTSLAKILNRPKIFATPAWLLSLLLGERAQLLINGQFALPEKLLASGFLFDYPQLTQALENTLLER